MKLFKIQVKSDGEFQLIHLRDFDGAERPNVFHSHLTAAREMAAYKKAFPYKITTRVVPIR